MFIHEPAVFLTENYSAKKEGWYTRKCQTLKISCSNTILEKVLLVLVANKKRP
jgi:hypothetical protein